MKKRSNLWRRPWSKALRILSALALLGSPLITEADDVEYAITDDNKLGTIDFQTGVFTPLGTGTIVSGGDIGDMARPLGGLVYLAPVNGTLQLVNPTTLQTSTIGSLPGDLNVIAFTASDTLLDVVANGTTLYKIDPTTAHIQSTVPLTGTDFPGATSYLDLKSDINGNTYLLTGSRVIWSVNLNTGAMTNVWESGSYLLYAIGDEAGRLYGFTSDGQIIQINLQGGQTLVSTESSSSPIVAVCNGGITAGQPRLNIQSTNQNSLELSWVAPTNQFVLQQNYDLTTSNWMTMTNVVNVTNSLSWIVISPSHSADFFRLVEIVP